MSPSCGKYSKSHQPIGNKRENRGGDRKTEKSKAILIPFSPPPPPLPPVEDIHLYLVHVSHLSFLFRTNCPFQSILYLPIKGDLDNYCTVIFLHCVASLISSFFRSLVFFSSVLVWSAKSIQTVHLFSQLHQELSLTVKQSI